MDIKQFDRFVNKSWECNPLNTQKELLGVLDPAELMKLAFLMGAGVGLLLCKSHGTDQISKADLINYMETDSVASTFAKLEQSIENRDNPFNP